jgi:predicted RNA-binding Zn-ribbon protein involved in translation (DUF1610 family)
MGKIDGITWVNMKPWFLFAKKHSCPCCSTIMRRVKCSKVVNSHSEEAKNWDFKTSSDMLGLSGNVKFIWYEFLCPKCNNRISVADLQKFERTQERRAINIMRQIVTWLFIFALLFMLVLAYAIPRAT